MDDLKQKSQMAESSGLCIGGQLKNPLCDMDFATAMVHLRHGQKIRRAIWKGYWFLATDVHCQCPSPFGLGEQGYLRGFTFKEIIVAVLADSRGCTPAQPYQEDLLAKDWQVIEFTNPQR